MQLDIHAIKDIIPHRYPFLLIDRVLDVSKDKCVAIKNVTVGEEFFQGHFPDEKVMPGVLLLEALAQAGCILFYHAQNLQGQDVTYYLGKVNGKFKRKVVPGDQLKLEIEPVKIMAQSGILKGTIKVGDELAVEAEFALSVVTS